MDRRAEIIIFLNFLFAHWMTNPGLTFCELLKHCCGDTLPNNDQELMAEMAERSKARKQGGLRFDGDGLVPESDESRSEKPSIDWGLVKSTLQQAMFTFGFPEAELKKDFHGTEYFDEGYKFDVNNDRLILDYVPGLDISPEAVERVRHRQEMCNQVMLRVLRAALGPNNAQ